uniref:Probable membrane transporter protein n=1 Tax=Magnetococcus massalia (strain MO-1) TaxID=451514 RepID=A0A1S7LF43_MAGMO|nr:Magnetosome protein MamO, Trypsin-like serine protease [Candidatus Magnetococcus massalia]
MKNRAAKKLNVPFCRQSWRIPAVILTLACLATFAWGFHLLSDHRDQLGKLSYLPDMRAEGAPNHALPGSGQPQGMPAAMPAAPVQSASALVRSSVVSLFVAMNKGGNLNPVGSGVLVNAKGYVVTAAHLVSGGVSIKARVATPAGRKEYQARLVKVIPEHDLAVVKLITRDSFPYLTPTDTRTYPQGFPLVAWGDGLQRNIISQSGSVTGAPVNLKVTGDPYRGLVPLNAIYHWAQSGGPVVDAQGTLLGVGVMFQENNGTVRGFLVPGYLIRAHFRDVLDLAPPTGNGMQPRASLGGGPNRAPPVMQVVAAQGPPGGGAVNSVGQTQAPPDPSSRPSDAWWENARNLMHNQFNLHLPSSPFDFSWLSPDSNSAHSQQNQIFGYPVSTFFGLILLGLVAGISGGMMTMGGGIIKVTGLMMVFGYGLVLVRPVAYLTNIFMYGAASLRYKRSGTIHWPALQPLIPWVIGGVVLGYFIGNVLDAFVIRMLLGLFALALGLKMVVEIWDHHRHGIDHEADRIKRFQERAHIDSRWMREGILGLPMGLISGILGITGGVVEVPLQRYVNGVPMRMAISNSAVLVFFASIVGSVVAMWHGISSGAFEAETPLIMALILLPGSYLGGMIGAWLTTVVPMYLLRWVYAVLMLVVSIRMFVV